LWAQSIRPIVDGKELGLSPELLKEVLSADSGLAGSYARVFHTDPATDQPETALVNVAKALASFLETIVTRRTPFDDFRDALERDDAAAMARFPVAAQRGLSLFVGKGRCSLCHGGPNFSSGEFEDTGVPYFVANGLVDPGRHGGIAILHASPFNLLGRYNDSTHEEEGTATRHVEQLHRNWGEFRVPSLRNVAGTAPYMHNGSLKTLEDVVTHYSEVDEERLHGDEGARLLRPLRLTAQEKSDLVTFLSTLSGEIFVGEQ
jgi:cytochrome c peroxidase